MNRFLKQMTRRDARASQGIAARGGDRSGLLQGAGRRAWLRDRDESLRDELRVAGDDADLGAGRDGERVSMHRRCIRGTEGDAVTAGCAVKCRTRRALLMRVCCMRDRIQRERQQQRRERYSQPLWRVSGQFERGHGANWVATTRRGYRPGEGRVKAPKPALAANVAQRRPEPAPDCPCASSFRRFRHWFIIGRTYVRPHRPIAPSTLQCLRPDFPRPMAASMFPSRCPAPR